MLNALYPLTVMVTFQKYLIIRASKRLTLLKDLSSSVYFRGTIFNAISKEEGENDRWIFKNKRWAHEMGEELEICETKCQLDFWSPILNAWLCFSLPSFEHIEWDLYTSNILSLLTIYFTTFYLNKGEIMYFVVLQIIYLMNFLHLIR